MMDQRVDVTVREQRQVLLALVLQRKHPRSPGLRLAHPGRCLRRGLVRRPGGEPRRVGSGEPAQLAEAHLVQLPSERLELHDDVGGALESAETPAVAAVLLQQAHPPETLLGALQRGGAADVAKLAPWFKAELLFGVVAGRGDDVAMRRQGEVGLLPHLGSGEGAEDAQPPWLAQDRVDLRSAVEAGLVPEPRVVDHECAGLALERDGAEVDAAVGALLSRGVAAAQVGSRHNHLRKRSAAGSKQPEVAAPKGWLTVAPFS